MKKAEKAKAYFEEGYNCCQAVVLAYCEELGFDKNMALSLSSSFGGGIGGMGEVCGAFSGMAMVAGLAKGYIDPKNADKKGHYEKIKALATAFEQRHGSIICRTLKSGKDRAFCAELVYDAASILEENL